MISATPGYLAAAAKNPKKPIFIITISDYYRALSNVVLPDAFAGTIVIPSTLGPWQGPISVPATSMPWNPLDTFVPYHVTVPGTSGVIIPCSPGDSIVVDYLGGLCFVSTNPPGVGCTPDGGPDGIGSTLFPWPSDRFGGTKFAGMMCGGYLDAGGAVLQVFGMGSNFTTPPAPAGTVSLSIGINTYEDWGDETGAWSIRWRLAGTTSVPTGMFDWLVSIEDLTVTVNDLDGGSDLADLVFNIQDRDGGITADFPDFTFEGKTVQLLCGYEGLPFSDFLPRFTGKIDSVEAANSNLEYCFTCPDARADLAQTIFTAGDDGFPTSSDHPLTLNGHPLDILLAALEVECGYLSSQVDEAKIISYRDGIYSGAQMQFSLTTAPVAKDFIESELMKPLGAYLRTNNLGQITVEFAYPTSLDTVFDFSQANIIGIPSAGQADLINQVLTRMDSDGNDFAEEALQSYQVSIDKYGLYGQQTIESQGLRSGLNGVFIASTTAFLLFLRYGLKALCYGDNGKNSASDPLNAFWVAALLDPGDFVTLSHQQVPDRITGTIGITNKAFVVLDMTWQFFIGNVQLKLIEIDLSKFKNYLVTPNAESDFTAASPTDKAKYMFLCGDLDAYSDSTPANTLA